MTAGAVPLTSVVGVNETTPVVVFTLYVPPVTETDVAVQPGAVSPVPQSRTDEAVKVISGSIVVSLPKTLFVCTTLRKPDDVSATAVGAAGGLTVGVIVALTYCPRSSTA